MKPGIESRPANPTKLGVISGMLGIVAGVAVTSFQISQGADLLEFPSWSWLMLAPLLLGLLSIAFSITAIVKTNEFKRPAMVFGVGLLAIATPYLIVLFAFTLVIALVAVIISQ